MKIKKLWHELYDDVEGLDQGWLDERLTAFMKDLDQLKADVFEGQTVAVSDWYKDAVIYSAYVDLFNKDFNGLKDKLDYLEDLGVNCLWLLPILESPMKDAGFDISDYSSIRPDLLGDAAGGTTEEKDAVFQSFVDEAHRRGIRIIFDIAMNHSSMEHPWFQEALKGKDNPYRDYFIWSDTGEEYSEARIIFKGMCTSNWEKEPISGQYFLHRFFEIQPDLNYKNPEVLLAMTQVLVDWKAKGVDGIRADAVPYIWKEEGTICENLPKTHKVVKFFRAVLDYLSPGSLLLAEACQPPKEVVEYFGDDDECNAAYHFPVMPRIYYAMAAKDRTAITKVMQPSFTPAISDMSQWFMFLRCHDELTLEMVTPEERKFIYDSYVKDPSWDFRQGEGIASRLADLLEFDEKRIMLAYSIMFTLLGTPIVYYGDEVAKGNDVAYFDRIFKETGYADTRYLGRGEMNWDEVAEKLKDEESLGYKVYNGLKKMIAIKKAQAAFGRGSLEFVDGDNDRVLMYERAFDGQKVLVIQNLSDEASEVAMPYEVPAEDLFGQVISEEGSTLTIEGYGYLWIGL